MLAVDLWFPLASWLVFPPPSYIEECEPNLRIDSIQAHYRQNIYMLHNNLNRLMRFDSTVIETLNELGFPKK